MVSLGSVGRSIKCPQCDRRLRVPKDAIAKRREQLAKKQAKANPKPKRSKIETRLSSLVEVPDPEPPPVFEAEVEKPRDDRSQEPKRKQKKKRLQSERKDKKPRKVDYDPPPVSEETERIETEDKGQPASDAVPKPPPRPSKKPAQPDGKQVAKEEKASRKRKSGADAETEVFEKESRGNSPNGKAETSSRGSAADSSSVAAFSQPVGSETEPPPLQNMEEEDVPVHGYQADRDKVATVRWLATALFAIALFGMIPAGREIAEHFRVEDGSLLHRWVYASLLICGLQLAYAGYLIQLPDWSSVWVVTIFSLIVAAAYAAMLCLTLLAGADSQFVQLLDLAERLRGGKATGWCFVMLCMTGLLAYSSGRVGSRWRQAFAM
jgi:hypothetical protein